MQRELQERCFDRKISNSRLVQVYMSKQPGMDAQKVLQGQYITAETLYMTYLREANDVLKLTTPRQSPRKKQKFSGGFRGVSALESEVSESAEVDPVSDEIRRWSNLSEGECQRFVSAEDGILNEFEMMWQLRILFPLHFVVFKQTACHLAAEANVEQVFSRVGQLSEVNLDPDTLADMVSIMVNKLEYKPSVKDIMDKYYEMFRGKSANKKDFFNSPDSPEHSDQDSDAGG